MPDVYMPLGKMSDNDNNGLGIFAFLACDILTNAIFTIWHFYLCHFYHLTFLPMTFLTPGIFSNGIFTYSNITWHFY